MTANGDISNGYQPERGEWGGEEDAAVGAHLARPSLSNLPPDLFSDNIFSHLSRFPDSLTDGYDAREDLSENLSPYISLSRTSRHLNAIINSLGYLSFVKTRYPSIFYCITRSPTYRLKKTDWLSVARASSQLELNWFDRSFVRKTEWVDESIAAQQQGLNWGPSLRGNRRRQQRRPARQPGQQTMGCTPALDVRDSEFNNADLVAAGVGTDIAIIDPHGDDAGTVTRVFKETGPDQPGVDDISGIHLLENNTDEEGYTVLVSRISGSLRLLQLSGESDVETLQSFGYDGNEPQEIVSSSRCDGIVLTTRENSRINAIRSFGLSIHQLPTSDQIDASTPILPVAAGELTSRPWCSTFLSKDTAAVGCKESMDVFRIRENGTLHSTFRKSLLIPASDGHLYPMSVNSVCGISHLYNGSNNIFASGWYDGCTRLYDLRTGPDKATMTLKDPQRHGEPIYSVLQTSPTSSQLLCGGSSYSILMFYDIRRPSGSFRGEEPRTFKQNSSVYVQHGDATSRSGIYSLATNAGGGGRKVYAGLEGAVVSLRFAGEDVDGWRFDDYVGKSMYYHDLVYRKELVPLGRSRRDASAA